MNRFLDGHYRILKDTLILSSDSGKNIKIFNNNLFDYPEKGNKVKMRIKLKEPITNT